MHAVNPMTIRTIRSIAFAVLGMMLALSPVAADPDAAVPVEKQNETVVGVAAGTQGAAPAATAPAPKAKKKKKAATRSAPMVAVPADTVQGTGATVQTAPPPPPPAAVAVPAIEQVPPAAAEVTAAASPQGAASAPPVQGATPDAAAPQTSLADWPAAADSPPPRRRQLGMRPAAAKSAPAAGAAAAAGATAAIVRDDIIGVVPPTGRITGRVLGKDGVTMLGGAELILDHDVFGSEHRVVTDASGTFDIVLPFGQYELAIQRRHEIFESPTSYCVARLGTLPVDFILLRDFEEQPADAPTGKGSAAGGDVSRQDGAAMDAGAERWLPEPHRQPEVVGSVVDLVSPQQDAPAARSRRNGAESLGFLGSILAILLVL